MTYIDYLIDNSDYIDQFLYARHKEEDLRSDGLTLYLENNFNDLLDKALLITYKDRSGEFVYAEVVTIYKDLETGEDVELRSGSLDCCRYNIIDNDDFIEDTLNAMIYNV